MIKWMLVFGVSLIALGQCVSGVRNWTNEVYRKDAEEKTLAEAKKAEQIRIAQEKEAEIRRRPSEIKQTRYKKDCRPFEACKGKYINFEGEVASVDGFKMRVKTPEHGFDLTLLEKGDPKLVGALVRFSGFLEEDHTFNDDVEKGRLISVTKSAEVWKVERAAKEAREMEEYKAKARAEAVAEATPLAARWKVPLEAVISGKQALGVASVDCWMKAKNSAQWQAERETMWRSSWDSWSMPDARTVDLQGSNMKMQNGFGAWRQVTYRCSYDLDSKTTVLLGVF